MSSLGSAVPKWFCAWLNLIALQLLVGGPPAAPPVAWDGVAGDADVAETVELTFAGNTITRAAGDFTELWLPGMTVVVTGSDSNDGSYSVVTGITATVLTLSAGVAFTAEGPTPDVVLGGSVPDGFALYVGPQWLQRWKSPPVCVIVPSYGEPSQPQALNSDNDRRIIGAMSIGVDIHVWGDEHVAEEQPSRSIWHDIDRYVPACDVIQNVMRALHYSSAAIGITYSTIDGWQNETEVNRFGESFIIRLACSFPIYDFQEVAIPMPQELDPRQIILQPGDTI